MQRREIWIAIKQPEAAVNSIVALNRCFNTRVNIFLFEGFVPFLMDFRWTFAIQSQDFSRPCRKMGELFPLFQNISVLKLLNEFRRQPFGKDSLNRIVFCQENSTAFCVE